MKLELKHLAPYLPYTLSLCRTGLNEKGLKEIYKLVLENKGVDLRNGIEIKDVLLNGYDKFKPILRPLSDLTTEFGKGFITKAEIELIHYHNEVLTQQYYVVEWMVRKHFDIFGLIEKGLAIDINTLK